MGFLSAINGGFSVLLNALLDPLDRVAPLLGLAALSVVVAVAMLLVFKATSDQGRIAEVKRRIQAAIFEIRLFNDDPRAILGAQADILRLTTIYLRLSSIPLLWMILPFLVVTAHLQARYGYQGLTVGEAALVKVHLKTGQEQQARSLDLEAPSGLRVETPMVWVPEGREAAWRIRGDKNGDYEMSVTWAETRVSKTVRVSNEAGPRSPFRLESAILNQILYPSEEPLPQDIPISSIAITYPEGFTSLFGWRVHWLICFLVFSFVAALALRRTFGVTF